ncbi:MAG: hypothetical protein LH481_16630 [Burkholderiales bacterium]|nr:hypothetical protein [Burkholderiales bacterium]
MKIRKSIQLIGALVIFVASTSAFAELCVVGKKTEVLWKGSWYKASILEAGKNTCFVTYAGYDNSYDEWVGPERLRISVLWKGDWYPAKVRSREGREYLISYDGYKSSDDEVVPLSRIQVR